MRSLGYALAILVAAGFIAGVELTYINGNGAAIILAAGALTAIAFSALKGIAMTKESEELDRAAAAYVASLPKNDPDRTQYGEAIEIGGPLGIAARIPKRMFGENTILLLLICAIGYFGYQHHIASEEALRKIYEATIENTYVLSLPQAEREKLNIAVPDSLRRKMRRE